MFLSNFLIISTYTAIINILMPDMDGVDAAREIRKAGSKQPVIISLTANTLQGGEEASIEAGMNDYLSKPIKLETLISKLQKWYRPNVGNPQAVAS